jgi:hypothetical protein
MLNTSTEWLDESGRAKHVNMGETINEASMRIKQARGVSSTGTPYIGAHVQPGNSWYPGSSSQISQTPTVTPGKYEVASAILRDVNEKINGIEQGFTLYSSDPVQAAYYQVLDSLFLLRLELFKKNGR